MYSVVTTFQCISQISIYQISKVPHHWVSIMSKHLRNKSWSVCDSVASRWTKVVFFAKAILYNSEFMSNSSATSWGIQCWSFLLEVFVDIFQPDLEFLMMTFVSLEVYFQFSCVIELCLEPCFTKIQDSCCYIRS